MNRYPLPTSLCPERFAPRLFVERSELRDGRGRGPLAALLALTLSFLALAAGAAVFPSVTTDAASSLPPELRGLTLQPLTHSAAPSGVQMQRTTEAKQGPINQPTGLVGTDIVSTMRLELRWQDNANNEDAYVVEIETNDGFVELFRAPENTEGVLIIGVRMGQSLTFRVAASNESGLSDYSNEVTVQKADIDPGLSGTYRIKVRATNAALHADDGGDRKLSTRYQSDDDFTRFVLERQLDASYKIRVKASNLYLHADDGGDRVLSTRYQPDDDFQRFYFEPTGNGHYRIRVKASNRYWWNDALGSQLVATETSANLAGLSIAEFQLIQEGSVYCEPSSQILCVNKGRFAVAAQYTVNGETKNASIVDRRADDSGLLSFFDRNNWEVLIKVLDACPINDRFWVFFAATTDVEFELTVMDTETSAFRLWTNEGGTAADPVTDTQAFATCR